MAETPYQALSADERRDALRVAEDRSPHRAFLLEKDIWVVATLRALFDAPFGKDLTFKGGTSLSKAYRAIRRFSEDVDITFDIRAFAPDLVADAGNEALPPTRSQERRWTRAIRVRLNEWVLDEAAPSVQMQLQRDGFEPKISADAERLRIVYEPLFDDYAFVRPEVTVEFGARSTGEPRIRRPVECDAAPFLPGLLFPQSRPSVMLAERTFWEKATAIHVYCRQERKRGERLSRHWHDLARLDDAGIAASALANRALAHSVARHKAMFFPEKDAAGNRIDYEGAVAGGLQLVPAGPALNVLAEDYGRMLADGMLLDADEPFERLLEQCSGIEARANAPTVMEAVDHGTLSVSIPASSPVPYTEKQGQYLAFIHAYTKVNGRPPAQADMQRFFAVTAPSVHQMVLSLERRGLLRRIPGRARSLEVLVDPENLPILR